MSGVEALAVERGRREGRREGRAEGRIRALYYDAGFSIEKIAETTEMPEDEIKVILTLKGAEGE